MGFVVDTMEVVEDDSVQNDPRNKAFYLAQIPLTDEAVQASHQQISEALFQAGVLEKDRLGNHSLAYKTLLRFVTDYPEHEKLPDAYYHLFLVNGRLGMDKEAAYYREKIISEYPDNEYAQLLANPRYELIARGGKHLEDSLYADAYGAYLRGEYAKVQDGYLFSSENFPEGRHISRFMFVYAMSQLYSGQRDSFLVTLKTLTEKYSAEEIGKLASEIMKGVQEGRLLNGDQWDASDIWSRRFNAGADEGVQSGDTLKDDRLGNFSFVLAYPKGGINEDQLLFELARYNFTSFTMRNFELEISDLGEVSMMLVKGFLSYDEAHSYAQKLYADSHMLKVIEGIRSLIILEENLNLLGTKYSFDDYQRFYEEYFSPLEIPEELKLDNGIIIRGEDELDDSVKDVPELEDNVNNTSEDDDFPFGF